MQDNPIIKAVDVVVAATTITYPLWRTQLHEWGGIAADAAPIFGIIWLVVQVYCKIDAHRRNVVLAKSAVKEEDDG